MGAAKEACPAAAQQLPGSLTPIPRCPRGGPAEACPCATPRCETAPTQPAGRASHQTSHHLHPPKRLRRLSDTNQQAPGRNMQPARYSPRARTCCCGGVGGCAGLAMQRGRGSLRRQQLSCQAASATSAEPSGPQGLRRILVRVLVACLQGVWALMLWACNRYPRPSAFAAPPPPPLCWAPPWQCACGGWVGTCSAGLHPPPMHCRKLLSACLYPKIRGIHAARAVQPRRGATGAAMRQVSLLGQHGQAARRGVVSGRQAGARCWPRRVPSVMRGAVAGSCGVTAIFWGRGSRQHAAVWGGDTGHRADGAGWAMLSRAHVGRCCSLPPGCAQRHRGGMHQSARRVELPWVTARAAWRCGPGWSLHAGVTRIRARVRPRSHCQTRSLSVAQGLTCHLHLHEQRKQVLLAVPELRQLGHDCLQHILLDARWLRGLHAARYEVPSIVLCNHAAGCTSYAAGSLF